MNFPNSLMYAGMRGREGLSGLGDIVLPSIVGPNLETTAPGDSGGFDWAGTIKSVVGGAVEAGKTYLAYDMQKTTQKGIQEALKTGAVAYSPTTGNIVPTAYMYPQPTYAQGIGANIPSWAPLALVGGVVALVLMRRR